MGVWAEPDVAGGDTAAEAKWSGADRGTAAVCAVAAATGTVATADKGFTNESLALAAVLEWRLRVLKGDGVWLRIRQVGRLLAVFC